MDLKATHFLRNEILDADAVDPNSYKFLEPKKLDRHTKAFLKQAKFKKIDELSPRGFKPKSQFYRKEMNPLDYAPSVPVQPDLDRKLKQFYKGSTRKFSINRAIDSKETFIASGGPSSHFVSARSIARQKFLAPHIAQALNMDAFLGNENQEQSDCLFGSTPEQSMGEVSHMHTFRSL